MLLASDIHPWLALGTAFIFGSLWGSFFNVAIHRWPMEMSVVSPPSRCPSCETRIPGYRNVPIFSFLLMRGKAPCCGAALTPRYLIVELGGALLCAAFARHFIVDAMPGTPLIDAALDTLIFFAFGGGLLIATFTDLEEGIIPDEVSLTLTAVALATATVRSVPEVGDAALGAGLGFLIIQLPFVWAYERLRGRRGMGEGDSKLLMMIGAFLGWRAVLFSLLLGACQGVIAVGILLATRRDPDGKPKRDSDLQLEAEHHDEEPPPAHLGHMKVKFGPFLALAALEYFFFGEVLIENYLSLLSVSG